MLYFAFGFLLVAPTVPWVRINSQNRDGSPGSFVYTGTMFSFYICQPPLLASASSTPLCAAYDLAVAANTLMPPPASSGAGALALPIVASTANNIAICCYVFSLLLLLPAAVLTSVSAYRLKLHLAHGQPTPTEGCAMAAHPLANILALLGFVCTTATVGAAFNLAGPTVGTAATAYLPAISGTDNGPSIAGMPGPVVGALAIACSLVASALLLLLSSCFPGLAALPGYGAGCTVTCNANPAAHQQAHQQVQEQAQQQAQLTTQMQRVPVFAAQYTQAAPPQDFVQVTNPCVFSIP